MKYFKLIYKTTYFTLLTFNTVFIIFSILSNENHFDLFLPIEIFLICLYFCFKYFSKNKAVFIIFSIIGILSLIIFFQQLICPKYKNCMPAPCPYGPISDDTCNLIGYTKEECSERNNSEIAKKSCDNWDWSEEKCKKIKWYCKGRTSIVW